MAEKPRPRRLVVRNHAAFRAVSGKKSDDLPRPRGLNGAVPDRHDAVRVDRVKAERPALPRGELQFVAVTIGFSPRDRLFRLNPQKGDLAEAIFHIGALIRALGRIIHVLKLTPAAPAERRADGLSAVGRRF